MTQRTNSLGHRVLELRDAFDRTFAEPARLHAEPEEELFGIVLAGSRYAVRLADASGLFTNKKIVRAPSRADNFLGIAGFRGTIMPVFDLSAVMGHARSTGARWLFVAAKTSIALAFDAFDGHLRVPSSALASIEGKAGHGRFVRNVVHIGHETRAMIDMAAVIKTLVQTQSQTQRGLS
jgi:purine-binding chemotaxis protein CheW